MSLAIYVVNLFVLRSKILFVTFKHFAWVKHFSFTSITNSYLVIIESKI